MMPNNLTRIEGRSVDELMEIIASLRTYIATESSQARESAIRRLGLTPSEIERVFPTPYGETERSDDVRLRELIASREAIFTLYAQVLMEVAIRRSEATIASASEHLQVELRAFAGEKLHEILWKIVVIRSRFSTTFEQRRRIVEPFHPHPDHYETAKVPLTEVEISYFDEFDQLISDFFNSLSYMIRRLEDPERYARALNAADPYKVRNFNSAGERLNAILEHPYIGLEEAPAFDYTIHVDAYLETDDAVVAREVLNALDEIASILGYEKPAEEEIEQGSIWRRAKVALRRGITHEEVSIRLVKLERALELAGIEDRQANVDVKTAEAVEKLMSGLQDIPQACMRVGSLLLVKYQDQHGPVLLVRSMSQLEVRAFERYPEIQQHPRTAFEALATAILSLERVPGDSELPQA